MLTDEDCKRASPRAGQYKLADGLGLCLCVKPSGARLWHYRFRFAGKENTLSFGAYPEISLEDARRRRAEARAFLDIGINPASRSPGAKAGYSVSSDGALSIRFGKRCIVLPADEAANLKRFLESTQIVQAGPAC